MNTAKSLWASIQGDPVIMKRINGWLTIVWIIMMPVAVITGWVYSVVFVSVISIYALVTGHLSTFQAARVEEHQENDADVQDVLELLKAIQNDMKKN